MTINKTADRTESDSSMQDAGRLNRDVAESFARNVISTPRASIISDTGLCYYKPCVSCVFRDLLN